jgi:hypothetical protein
MMKFGIQNGMILHNLWMNFATDVLLPLLLLLQRVAQVRVGLV